jgi:glycosyltransferase involved in cell wall biosynthesis
MNKYTVIIPTLWKSNRTEQLLNDLINSEFVDDIVIIDNSDNLTPIVHPKIQHIIEGQNTYVTPAWNKGVTLAKNENIAICNDDINFNPNIFGLLLKNNIEGIIGQASQNYNNSYDEIPFLSELTGIRPWGWGSLLLTQKQYWISIPEELKVWYNDDFITQINPCKKWILNNFTIVTEMSTTSDLPEFNSIKENDRIEWEKIKNKQ